MCGAPGSGAVTTPSSRHRSPIWSENPQSQYVSPVDLALLYAQLGQREKTLAFLEAGLRERNTSLLWIQCDPAFDFFHNDERYRSIIRKIGLPPAW